MVIVMIRLYILAGILAFFPVLGAINQIARKRRFNLLVYGSILFCLELAGVLVYWNSNVFDFAAVVGVFLKVIILQCVGSLLITIVRAFSKRESIKNVAIIINIAITWWILTSWLPILFDRHALWEWIGMRMGMRILN